ncbi:MAG: hypothetical protein QXS16_04695 [Pyrobaculum sp.]
MKRPALNGIGEAVRPGDLVTVYAGVSLVEVATMRMWIEMAGELAAMTPGLWLMQ